jgi:hypothetical protein
MKKFIFFTFLLFYLARIFAQLEIVAETEVSADFFTIDKFGNFYFVKGDKIIKTDKNFDTIAEFSDKSKGNIGSIDALDPFRLMIFYPQFNSIVFLDKVFNQLRSTIFLDDIEYFSVAAVCSSNFGSFRIFNNNCNCIQLIDNNLRILQRSSSLNFLSFNVKITKILEINDHVLAFDDTGNIYIFDIFGTFISVFNDVKAKDIVSYRNTFIILDNQNYIYIFNPSDKGKHEIQKIAELKNIKEITSFAIHENQVFILSDKRLIIFRFEN